MSDLSVKYSPVCVCTRESKLVKRLTELLVPPEHTLFGAVECNIELCDWTGKVSTRSIAFWELHVNIFTLVEFAIEECRVEVKDVDVPVVVCGDCEYSM